ncbi:unnamed protein product [Calypogeia fissa]
MGIGVGRRVGQDWAGQCREGRGTCRSQPALEPWSPAQVCRAQTGHSGERRRIAQRGTQRPQTAKATENSQCKERRKSGTDFVRAQNYLQRIANAQVWYCLPCLCLRTVASKGPLKFYDGNTGTATSRSPLRKEWACWEEKRSAVEKRAGQAEQPKEVYSVRGRTAVRPVEYCTPRRATSQRRRDSFLYSRCTPSSGSDHGKPIRRSTAEIQKQRVGAPPW